MSYMPEGSYHSDWDREMESLRRQIKDLELEMRGRHQRRTPKGSSHDQDSVGGHIGGPFHQGHSRLSRDRSNESRGRGSMSSRKERDEHPNATMDAMSRALRRIARSPFS